MHKYIHIYKNTRRYGAACPFGPSPMHAGKKAIANFLNREVHIYLYMHIFILYIHIHTHMYILHMDIQCIRCTYVLTYTCKCIHTYATYNVQSTMSILSMRISYVWYYSTCTLCWSNRSDGAVDVCDNLLALGPPAIDDISILMCEYWERISRKCVLRYKIDTTCTQNRGTCLQERI